MEDEEYQDIFEWLPSKIANGNSSKKLKWPAKIMKKPQNKEEKIKNANMKRCFREKAIKFHVNTADGLLYRNPERQHPARPVLKAGDVGNLLISSHGTNNEHRGVKDM